MHKTRGNGQLRPLEDRMSAHNLERRSVKMINRLAREHAETRGAVVVTLSVMKRHFPGRLKWLLFGR